MLTTLTDILKYTFTSVSCLLALVVFFFIFELPPLLCFLLTLALGAILYYTQKGGGHILRAKSDAKGRPAAPLQRVTPQKETFYKSRGLSKEEMNMFRSTMHTAREQIYAIEDNMKQRTKLKAIEARNNTLAIMKDFFKHIVEQPERLPEVNKFLYTHLPSLKELTDHYLEIDSHVAKTRETYRVLEESAQTINEMCELIAEDYVAFMNHDLENLDVEMELAKHVLKRDNETNKKPSEIHNDEL